VHPAYRFTTAHFIHGVRAARTVGVQANGAKLGNMAQIKMYTREYCGYCDAAKSLLEGKRISYEEIDCTGDDKTRAWLRTATGQTTVPQIFIDGKSIGGYTELRALDRSGELAKLLGAETNAAS